MKDRNIESQIKCYDNGGKTIDHRYTVVFIQRPSLGNTYECLGMDDSPFNARGICMHGNAVLGRHLGKRIKFEDLPRDCQIAVKNDLEGNF